MFRQNDLKVKHSKNRQRTQYKEYKEKKISRISEAMIRGNTYNN